MPTNAEKSAWTGYMQGWVQANPAEQRNTLDGIRAWLYGLPRWDDSSAGYVGGLWWTSWSTLELSWRRVKAQLEGASVPNPQVGWSPEQEPLSVKFDRAMRRLAELGAHADKIVIGLGVLAVVLVVRKIT